MTGRKSLCGIALLAAAGPADPAVPPRAVPPFALQSPTGAQTAGGLLTPGSSRTSALEPGGSVAFLLRAGNRQSVRGRIDQGKYDIASTVLRPDGTVFGAFDSSFKGAERFCWVADASGIWQLKLRPVSSGKIQFSIVIEEVRDAVPEDSVREEAFRSLSDGKTLAAQGNPEAKLRAVEKYMQALSRWRSLADTAGELVALRGLGYTYTLLFEYRKAIEVLLRALPVQRATGERDGEAGILGFLGYSYNSLGDGARALEYFRQQLPIVQELGQRREEGVCLHNIGLAWSIVGDKEQALAHYSQALPIRREIGDEAGEAVTLNCIAYLHLNAGEPEEAMKAFEDSLALRRKTGDRRGEAITLEGIGYAHWIAGDFESALREFAQEVEISHALADWITETGALNRLGLTYLSLGMPDQALAEVQRAFALVRDRDNPGLLADTRHNLGLAHATLRDYRSALEEYREVLEIRRRAGDKRREAQALNNLAWIHGLMGNHDSELDLYSRALELERAAGDRSWEAVTLRGIGWSYLEDHKPQLALEPLRTSASLFRSLADLRNLAPALLGVARAKRDLGNLEDALPPVEEAMAIVGGVRARIFSGDLRTMYQAGTYDYYEFFVDLLMRLRNADAGYAARALEASERARARRLLDLLADSRARIRASVDPALLARERAVLEKMNAQERQRTRLLGGEHTEAELAAINRAIASVRASAESIRLQIRMQSPRYAALTQPQPIGAAGIQEKLLDGDTLLLEYFLADETSYLWVVSRAGFREFSLPGRRTIESAARLVYDLAGARNQHAAGETMPQRKRRIEAADLAFRKAAAELSRLLLEPAADLLGDKRLAIVCDGVLQHVPFAALPDPCRPDGGGTSAAEAGERGDYRPLLEGHEIVFLPSASVLAAQRRLSAGRVPGTDGIAVIADPVFSMEDARVNGAATGADAARDQAARAVRLAGVARESGMTFHRLRFTRDEALAIASFIPPGRRFMALGFDANLDALHAADLGSYRVIHFATHGLVSSTHPDLSGLVLSLVDERGRPRDGFFRLRDIFDLDLRADLVVLSGCQTALGAEIRGEGLVGLTRAFMYAGARRVAASLWSVDDRATAELMRKFYQEFLGEGRAPAQALRAAQLSLFRQRRWAAPYYWAAFTLQGDWK